MAINHKQPCLFKFSSNVVPVVTTNGVFKLHFLLITDPVARFQSKHSFSGGCPPVSA